jgi:hypothetical protein
MWNTNVVLAYSMAALTTRKGKSQGYNQRVEIQQKKGPESHDRKDHNVPYDAMCVHICEHPSHATNTETQL